ncbi:MAG: FAD-dependent oxidoreductase [Rhodospirillales bacterium]|nr:FAD-dependent oxidoreductase [Rhodospirillales bacterium]MSP80267.1 FAD-dependent oxidoreductase [Rhodospirillales bacterium]
MNVETPKKTERPLTFRRYADGADRWRDLQEKIFSADWSHKCPTYVHRTPPCQSSCPSGHDIRGWLQIARGIDKPPVAGMKWQEYAFRRMAVANPFPSIMGRVCPAPCETGCNRNAVDDFVGINGVEQYVGDWATANNVTFAKPNVESGKKVAIIGAGPAGLSAALFLRGRGHGVTLFESQPLLGGMMRYGIPGYRTPRATLDAEINRIVDTGVVLRMGVRVGRDVSVEELERDFDAIFWGIGAQVGRKLPAAGSDASNVISGVDFLRAFNEGRLKVAAKRVVVVGGGDTSIDVASVARRLGFISHNRDIPPPEAVAVGHTAQDVAGVMEREGVQAVLTSLFPIDKMTAAAREREDAMREGVEIKGGVMPLEVIKGPDGRARALKMCQCTMKGNAPVPTPGTEFEIECDLIVSAIGQGGDLKGMESFDNGRGLMAVEGTYQVKGKPKHFAGGDIVQPHLLTTAIGHAGIAAESIDKFLAGQDLGKRPKVDKRRFNILDELRQRNLSPVEYDRKETYGTDHAKFAVHNYEDRSFVEIVKHDDMFLGHFPYVARNKRQEIHIGAENVIGNFEERIVNFTEAQAVAEGKRCMSCGMCFECDNCVIYCPQTAVFRVKKDQRAMGRYVDTDYKKCIGCHICADVCPTGYIEMGLGE